MQNFLIIFLFLIFATNNILFAEEITVYNKANAEKCAQGNCVNGQGTLTWTDGAKYEGEFKDEKMTGQGTLTLPNGMKYVGEFKDNKSNGQGTLTYPDGMKYVGEFKDNKFNGQGTLTLPNGIKYVGEFKDNKSNGQGTLTYPNGNKYVGGFKDNKRNGQGTFTWANGDKYVGEYKENKLNGQGTFTWANGDKYVGEFKDNKSNGQGTFTWANGDKRVGEWKNGKAVDGNTKLIETAANKRKRIEDEKRQRAKENNDQQRVINQFTKIKTDAINAINKAQSCYNSLDSLSQSQMSGALLEVKKTHLHAKTTEKNMKISNIDVTRATELHNWYGLTTREANRIVSAYCN